MIEVGPYKVLQIRSALAWQSPLAIDDDGDPSGYNPDSAKGNDNLGNAVDLVRDLSGHLVIQGQPVIGPDGAVLFDGADQPSPGFYISPNLLVDHARSVYDARRYGDASKVPFIVRPPELAAAGVHMLDVAIVVNQRTGASCSALFGDAGNHGKLTEVSRFLAREIGKNDDARRGGDGDPSAIAVLAWPGSGKGWPRSNEDVAAQVIALLNDWGGTNALVRAVRVGVE